MTNGEFSKKWNNLADKLNEDEALVMAGRINGTWYSGGQGSRNLVISSIATAMDDNEEFREVILSAVKFYKACTEGGLVTGDLSAIPPILEKAIMND